MVTWNGAQPVLGEPLDSHDGQRRWRASVDGRPAVVTEIEARGESDAAQIGERLRRLANHPDGTLRPMLGWARDGARVSVATDADQGKTLAELLESGPLSPAEAAAVGWSVLTGLQVLHEAGLAHGRLDAGQVRIGTAGRPQVDGHWFNPARRATSDDLLGDIEAAGGILCAALGIGVHPDPSSGPTPAERDAPALSRTARAIASGASGSNVSGARMALSATAGSMVQPDGLGRAAALLAARVRGEAVAPPPLPPAVSAPDLPADRPALRPEPAGFPANRPPAVRPRSAPTEAPQRYVATAADFREMHDGEVGLRRLSVPLMVAGGILVVLFLLWGGISLVRGLTSSHPTRSAGPPAASATPRATAKPTATGTTASTPTATPKPSGPPSFGPASADPIKSVDLSASGCSPGGSCSVEVTVHTSAAASSTDVQWTIKAYDVCSGTTSDLAQNKVTEQGGWNTVIGDSSITVPSGKAIQLVAVTSSPTTAASAPTAVGSSSC